MRARIRCFQQAVTNVASCVLDNRTCVVTLDRDGWVRVRDVQTGQDVRDPAGPGSHGPTTMPEARQGHLAVVTVNSVPHVVVPTDSGSVECWSLDTGHRRWLVRGTSRSGASPLIEDLEAFRTPSGASRLGVLTEEELLVIDPATGLPTVPALTVPMDSAWQVWALPDGRSTDLVAVTSGWGEVALWDLTGSRIGGVYEKGIDPVTIRGYREREGAHRLAVIHQQDPGVVLSWQPEVARVETLLESTSPFLFADDPRLGGAVATTRNSSVVEGRRLCDGEVVLRADHPATGEMRWLVACPGRGSSTWACCFEEELRFLNTAAGRWSEPITTFHPMPGWGIHDIKAAHAAPEGRLLLTFIDGWAVVEPSRARTRS
ncbi:hypothetical protein [Arachnia propionica]|uniref:WD40 repeat domain-containing protein n=1 Tax=Arachnia propionica TaxID=1750 RepID=A0A3P1WP53_9ACTN|nr:hypothetical protein [Arachnia propionica]RRD48352.1 hypothetical protein EII35_13225 [Arachnia propionica]